MQVNTEDIILRKSSYGTYQIIVRIGGSILYETTAKWKAQGVLDFMKKGEYPMKSAVWFKKQHDLEIVKRARSQGFFKNIVSEGNEVWHNMDTGDKFGLDGFMEYIKSHGMYTALGGKFK